MSLINEALRRARLEAARQEAARRGDPPPVLPAALPDRRRFPWTLFVSALVIGVVLTGATLWLMGWNRAATPSPPVPVETAEAATARLAPAQPTNPARERSATPLTATPSTPRARIPRPETARKAEAPAQSPRSRPIDTSGAGGDDARPAAAIHCTPAPAAGSEASLVDGFTYVASIDVRGRHLVLSGIAWSASHPTAVLNDAAVGKGDEVAGFRVIKVEPDRVELQADGKTVFLRLP